MFMIKEMPIEDRPRERLIHFGVEALSNEELIAILLRTGEKSLSVIDLSKEVLYHLSSLHDLKSITIHELMLIKGIKEAKAATLIAAIELGKRVQSLKPTPKIIIHSAHDVYHLCAPHMSHLMQEHFMVLYISTKSELITKETIFVGTINQTLIHPREIFKLAIKVSAAAILLVHNHPTGDATPSKADLEATQTIMNASYIVGIDVIDHIIIGHHEFYSVKDRKKVRVT